MLYSFAFAFLLCALFHLPLELRDMVPRMILKIERLRMRDEALISPFLARVSLKFPSGGGSVFLHSWAALNQGVILLAGTSQDGPLVRQPIKVETMSMIRNKILSVILGINADSDTVSL